jgi:predicted component of viral defense system (DUF524 family)
MTTQELIEKSKTEALSEEELKQILEGMNSEMQELKEKDPKKYLALLQELNSIISDLNTDLKSV